jgi:hypothetical protein
MLDTMKKQMKASDFRLQILREFRKIWEKNPDKRAFIETQIVWSPIWEKQKNRITPEFGTAVLASLTQDQFLESTVAQNPMGEDVSLSRITDKGLEHLLESENSKMTRRIALLGAVTGSLGLIISILNLFI